MKSTTVATPQFYDIRNPHNKFAVGQVEVRGDKIVSATEAYRWTIGFVFYAFNAEAERRGYEVTKRRTRVAKNFGTTPSNYKKPNPSTRELLKRISP